MARYKTFLWSFNFISGNYYNADGRGNIRLKNERFACDPRLRRAAVDCLSNNFCDFNFDDLQNLVDFVIDQDAVTAGT